MDLRFLTKLREGGPTQFELGRQLCNNIVEACDTASGRPFAPIRIEDVITALMSAAIQMIVDGGYDPIGVTMLLIEAYDRGGPGKPRDLVDA